MKRLLYGMLAVAGLLLAGCKGTDEPSSNSLSVNPEFITCPDAGGDYTVELNSPQGAWTAACSESWIKVTPASGDKGKTEVRIKITANKESAESQGAVTFTSGEETVTMPVTRAAKAAPYLRVVSDMALNTPKEGGTYTVQVESNIKWSASSNASWAKVSKGVSVDNDRFTVTVSPATAPEKTIAIITIAPYGEGAEAGKQMVVITRGSAEATSLAVDQVEISAPEEGGAYTVSVNSNARWRVYKTWDMDWVELDGSTEGTGNGSFTFSVAEATSKDAVSGIITIKEVRSDNYEPVVAQVAVSRAGKITATLTLKPNTPLNAPYKGGVYTYTVISSHPWEATLEGSGMFSASVTSCEYENAITIMNITVEPAQMTQPEERTGKIIIRTTLGHEEAVIPVHREAYPNPPHDKYSFRVSDEKQVYFAQGNLQYNPKHTYNNEPEQWRFAPQQYMVVDNASIARYFNTETSTGHALWLYDGWVDLFSYATSGYNRYPYEYAVNKENLSLSQDIAGTYDDWGEYLTYINMLPPNETSCGKTGTGQWRTLTDKEWSAIIYREMNLPIYAKVNNVGGIILLPDLFEMPANLSVSLVRAVCYKGHGGGMNIVGSYNDNNISLEDWYKLENAGAVFLPQAGTGRYHETTTRYGWDWEEEFSYWTSTIRNSDGKTRAYYVGNNDGNLGIFYRDTYVPCAVRLVQNVK